MGKDDLQAHLNQTDLEKIPRKKTRQVRVCGLSIGGNAPIVIQEMTSTYTADIDATVGQIKQIEEEGCRLIRVAIPDEESAQAVREIKKRITIPLVGDIHFDYRLALRAIENGIDKLRINPGNIGGKKKIAALASAAGERAIPIRIGVNSGSLERALLRKNGGVTPEAMVESALGQVYLLEQHRFQDIVISLKSPDIRLTVEANRLLSSRLDYPLHIGITESGLGEDGLVRSVEGLSILLLEGIGDTVRISLTEEDRSVNLRLCRSVLERLGIPYV